MSNAIWRKKGSPFGQSQKWLRAYNLNLNLNLNLNWTVNREPTDQTRPDQTRLQSVVTKCSAVLQLIAINWWKNAIIIQLIAILKANYCNQLIAN